MDLSCLCLSCAVHVDWSRPADDGVNTVKTICGDGRMVPGAGATEIEVARQVQSFANTCPGLEQYSIKKFGEALEVVPKILAENSGQLATEVLSQLFAAHAKGNAGVGVNVSVSVASKTNAVYSYRENNCRTTIIICTQCTCAMQGKGVVDATSEGILDSFKTKTMALELAMEAALTILRVDQVIVQFV